MPWVIGVSTETTLHLRILHQILIKAKIEIIRPGLDNFTNHGYALAITFRSLKANPIIGLDILDLKFLGIYRIPIARINVEHFNGNGFNGIIRFIDYWDALS